MRLLRSKYNLHNSYLLTFFLNSIDMVQNLLDQVSHSMIIINLKMISKKVLQNLRISGLFISFAFDKLSNFFADSFRKVLNHAMSCPLQAGSIKIA